MDENENEPDNEATEAEQQNDGIETPSDSSDAEGPPKKPKPPKPKTPKPKPRPDDPVSMLQKIKLFVGTYWKGIVSVLTPLLLSPLLFPLPAEDWAWCAFTLCLMAVYWVVECLPHPVTAFFPVIVFPLTGIMDTFTVASVYLNDTVIMFLGSIMLAASVEQSGLHRRIALMSIRLIGYSHLKMLFAVSYVTMFISMWITNTAATTMMVPIVFALLRVYEDQKLYKTFEKDDFGELKATRLTSCYFCCITFAATIGGIGTLVGTATNLVFKGLFQTEYPNAPELLSFPLYSAFAVPYMFVCTTFMYLFLAVFYMGLFRPNSAAAKSIHITPEGLLAAKRAVAQQIKELGAVKWHEIMVIILFGLAMMLFFTRSPQLFTGWGDVLESQFGLTKKFVRDSAAATMVIFLMTLFAANKGMFKNCTAKYPQLHRHLYGWFPNISIHFCIAASMAMWAFNVRFRLYLQSTIADTDELPKGPVRSVLDWSLMNKTLPYSFAFLLAGGFALSTAAKPQYADLNGQIGKILDNLVGLPNTVVLMVVIIFTTLVTNFASNVAVCNVITPIAIQLAKKVGVNPLWYCIASGVTASYCFLFPVGTPGNLIVQSAAKIPTSNMIVAGSGPTFTTILLSWVFLYLYAPIIWPDLHVLPDYLTSKE